MQVLRLVYKMREESNGIAQNITRKQLQEKIVALPQPLSARATDALAVITDGMKGSLVPPPAEPQLAFSVTPPILPNWHRVKLGLLKSISTGTFIDIQFYAYNATRDDMPLDPRPLFTSSIVIEEWGPAITTRKSEVPPNSHDSNLRLKLLWGWTLKPRVWWTDQQMIMKVGTRRSLKTSSKRRRYCTLITYWFLGVERFLTSRSGSTEPKPPSPKAVKW